MNEIKKLRPFQRFCMTIGNLPSSYVESMSYEETLYWLCSYLEKTVIPTINNNSNVVLELQEYIKNYFSNLDVQEEINNKLDDMAESGQLADIIAQYIQLAGILAFNTKADLKNATNIVDGSVCKTLGNTTYNDGYGNLYKIRTMTSGDVVDDDNILALSISNTLIAEKIPNNYINDINDNIDNINDNIDNINDNIDNINNFINNLNRKKYVFIGDSYLQGYTPSGEVQNWGAKLANLLGLNNNQWRRIARGGTAMNSTNENNFYNLLANETVDNDVTDVILAAGYNDHQDIGTYASILDGMTNFKNRIATLYPNAKLKIGFIGNTSIVNDKYGVMSKCPFYIQCCQELGIDYMNNVEYALHNYNTEFGSDGIHPNDNGQKVIAQALYQVIKTGSAHICRSNTPVISSGSDMYFSQENNILTFKLTSLLAGNFSEPKTVTMNGNNHVLILPQFNNSLAVGCGSTNLENSATIPVYFVEETTNKTILVPCRVSFDNRYLSLIPFALNDNGTNYLTTTIKSYQIRPFNMILNALYN